MPSPRIEPAEVGSSIGSVERRGQCPDACDSAVPLPLPLRAHFLAMCRVWSAALVVEYSALPRAVGPYSEAVAQAFVVVYHFPSDDAMHLAHTGVSP